MADAMIGSLSLATSIGDDDLFVLQQGNLAKRLRGETLTNYIDRNIISVTVTQLPSTASPTASYNRVTGRLTLGLPKGTGLKNIIAGENNEIIYIWDDDTRTTLGTVRGETGMSAYDYAVEYGNYSGTESEYGDLMAAMYNAAVAEADRVAAEEAREEHYQEIMDTTDEQLERFAQLMRYADSKVINTTLLLYRAGVRVYETTAML